MGACCTTHMKYRCKRRDKDDDDSKVHREDITRTGHNGAIVRLHGSSSFVSMHTRKGKKSINQDSITVWENFMGEKNAFFCGVFDGHGPTGHRVARHICNILPFKLSSIIEASQPSGCKQNDAATGAGQSYGTNSNGVNKDSDKDIFSPWKANLIKAFTESDEDLNSEVSLDSYSSGTTAVTIIKQGEHLIISNLGDSRAILCTRDYKNQPLPIQLTVDLKPSIPDEAERIRNCGGRVFAYEGPHNIQRVWMPNQDCPGLAMTRAFGDFCLKDCGLISTPQVSYRRLTGQDEFVVLATDGVWDVLTNKEVIRIIGSVKKQSKAAKVLVHYAVEAWKSRYPGFEVDDCAVICLFLKKQPLLSKSSFRDFDYHMRNRRNVADSNIYKCEEAEEGETVINCDISVDK